MVPCFWSTCSHASTAPALILIIAWPMMFIAMLLMRFCGRYRFSLFELEEEPQAVPAQAPAPAEAKTVRFSLLGGKKKEPTASA